MNLKQARGQLRQIVKELLPDLLTVELKSALYSGLVKTVEARLKGVEEEVIKTMNEINERSKSASDYLVRHSSEGLPSILSPPPEAAASTKEGV